MERMLLLIVLSALALPFAIAQDNKSQAARSVKGQVLMSKSLPAVRLTFDRNFKYIGSQDFILYDVARAEQHFFVDADAQGNIKRFYWVQFEGYLPSNTHTYNYKSPKIVNIAGLDFFADTYFVNAKTNPSRPDSDGSRMQAFLKSKGYRIVGDDVMLQRLVYMADEGKRNELMIIYMEDLSPLGLTAADLSPNGSAASRREELTKALLERAQKGMKIER